MAERKIGGQTFRVKEIYAKRALKLFAQLGKVLGPAMPELVAALGSKGTSDEDKTKAGEAAAKAMSRVMADLDTDAFVDLVQELVETAEVQEGAGYMPVDFDGHFTGKLEVALKVMGFVLQQHFGPFFSAILADTKAVKATAA